MRGTTTWIGGLAGLLLAAPVMAGVQFHWEDAFTPDEQAKLVAWIEETHQAMEGLVGPFPFDIHVHFHRRDGARGPVPWANTRRYRAQAVHFHVDPAHTLDAFRRDWVASHELSHLVLPFLGSRNAWFAEGFASYMQYKVMHAMGTLSPEAMAARYRDKLDRAARDYPYADRPFAHAAPRLRAARRYPTMYWGGAAYFLQVDDRLRRTHQTGVIEVVAAFLDCCRHDRDDLDTLVARLDALAGADVFSERLRHFNQAHGFPDYRDLILE